MDELQRTHTFAGSEEKGRVPVLMSGKSDRGNEVAPRRGVRASIPDVVLAHTAPVKALGDMAAWAVGIFVAAVVRYDIGLRGLAGHSTRLWLLIGLAALVQVTFGSVIGVYRNHWRFASFEEVAVLAQTVTLTLLSLMLADALLRRSLPVVLSLGAAISALCLMVGTRYVWRLLEQYRLRPAAGRPTLVFGAGEGAEQLLQSLLRNPSSAYNPVAILDDDPGKANLRIKGVRVVGDRTCIGAVAKAYNADLLVLAVPSASSGLVREVTDLAREAGVEVRVLPPTSELLHGQASVQDIRTPTIADLLGRRQVETDVNAIASYLRGRRVLVTGAGGSIGSELCRQLARLEPSELMMLDRDESALHAVQLSLDGRGMLDSRDLVLLDIRDRSRLREFFLQRRPEVVFHAAALKHLTLLEAHPAEAVMSNVWGTQNVIDAAMASGVGRFVNISTDKAADPTCVLGHSKRIAERLTAQAARTSAHGRYLSVRFGNVLGSRGSVLPAFCAQIEAGGPVLVTHPEVSRYFMTIEEAVQLVIQAGEIGSAGAVMVLDMGDPVRIADVAQRMIRESGRQIDVVYTGLRPGEKLHEDLFAAGEESRATAHPLVFEVPVPPLAADAVNGISVAGPPEAVRTALAKASCSGIDEVIVLRDEEVIVIDDLMVIGGRTVAAEAAADTGSAAVTA